MRAASAGAPRTWRPVLSRETYGPSSAAVRKRSASSSRSASESAARRSSGANRASVPKSGLASTAIARSFKWVASRLPTTNVLVVFPTPPFGLISAIVFGRVTPRYARIRRSRSASSRSAFETNSCCMRRRNRPPRSAHRPPIHERLRIHLAPRQLVRRHQQLKPRAGHQQVPIPGPDPGLVSLPQPVDLACDLRRRGTVRQHVGGDRPQRLALLDDVRLVTGLRPSAARRGSDAATARFAAVRRRCRWRRRGRPTLDTGAGLGSGRN